MRIAALDIARTMALVAMVVFHFVFDLELFGYIAPGTSTTGFWRGFAIATAGSFLFLAGVALWLAHGSAVRWPAFWRRFLKIVGAAALVTVATYLMFPSAFVFFGILHSIALCSLIGLVFLRLPPALILAAAAFVLLLPRFVQTPVLDAPIWWWTGLQEARPSTMDYEPIFPWLAPLLLGVALAKWATARGLWSRLARSADGRLSRMLSLPGRHSLLIYLIHQPILISGFWLVSRIHG